MTSRTRQSRSPPKWAGALFILSVLGCATGRKISADDTSQQGYFDREGNSFQKNLNDEAKKSNQNISPDTIVIGLLKNTHGGKNLTYIPSELDNIPSGTPVTWLAWDGPFTLTFKPREDQKGRRQNWPFEGPEAPIQSTKVGAIQSAARTVRAGAEPGPYHFTVHLTDVDGKPYDDLDCPPIIIQ